MSAFNLANITLNGMPLERVLEAEHRAEISAHRKEETKSIGHIVAHSRPIISRSLRNHSGSRSGKGRVIFSARGNA